MIEELKEEKITAKSCYIPVLRNNLCKNRLETDNSNRVLAHLYLDKIFHCSFRHYVFGENMGEIFRIYNFSNTCIKTKIKVTGGFNKTYLDNI